MTTLQSPNRSAWSALALGLLLVAAAALRFERLNERSLWFDEGFSLRLSEECDASEIVQRTSEDVHPPLYYLLLSAWIHLFGATEAAARSLSATLGVLSVGAAFVLCKVGGARTETALTAAALIAVQPTLLHHDRDARMYSLGVFLALACATLMLRALESSASRISWIAFACAATALVYTHNYGLFLVASFVCYAAVVKLFPIQRPINSHVITAVTPPAAAALVVAIAYSPWMYTLVGQSRQVKGDYWISEFEWRSLLYLWPELLLPANADRTWNSYVGAAFVITGSVLVSLVVAAKRNRVGRIAVAAALGTTAIAVIVSLAVLPVFFRRYLVFTIPFVCIGFALGLESIPSLAMRRLVAIALISTFTVAWSQFEREMDIPHRSGVKGAARLIASRFQAGDSVAVLHPCVYLCTKYYLRQERIDVKLFVASRSAVRPHHGASAMRESDYLLPDEAAHLRRGAVWLIDSTGYDSFRIRATLPDHWKRAEQLSFPAVFPFEGNVLVTRCLTTP